MPKPTDRAYSRSALEGIALLGQLIRIGRIERKLTAQDLAARAGISRALLYRIEQGDPACSIGAVFEAATIVGVPLFDPHQESGRTLRDLRNVLAHDTARRLTLLPKKVRTSAKVVKDDF